MAVAAVVVTKIVRMSRRWKADLVSYKIYIQTSSRFMYHVPLQPDHSSVCPNCPESFHHPDLTSKFRNYQTVHWNRSYE
jgi:hypothetical protein